MGPSRLSKDICQLLILKLMKNSAMQIGSRLRGHERVKKKKKAAKGDIQLHVNVRCTLRGPGVI